MKFKNLILFACFMPAFVSGQEKLDSLLNQLKLSHADTHRVELLDIISFTYSGINPDTGLKYGLQAKALAESLEWKKGLAAAYSDIALNYEAKFIHSMAIQNHLKSLKQYRELKMKGSEAGVLSNISLVYENQGDYANALSYAYQALKICEEIGDSLKAAMIWENSGTIYMRQKDYSTAMTYYTKALSLHQSSGNKVGEARVLGNMGILHDASGNYPKALEYHSQALEVSRINGNKNSEQINLMNLGIVHCHMQNFKKALSFQLEAMQISEEYGMKGAIAINSGNIGETYFFMASDMHMEQDKEYNLSLAIAYLERAIALCKEISYSGPMIEFGPFLSDAYVLNGDHQKALAVFKEITALKDSISSQEQLIKLKDIEITRGLELREKELEIHDKQLVIAQLTAANKRNERALYLSGMAVLLLIGIIVAVRFRGKMRSHQAVLSDIAHIQSHELRGPLARILGLIQLLDPEKSNDPNKKLLTYIRTSGMELDQVIKKVVSRTAEEKTRIQENAS